MTTLADQEGVPPDEPGISPLPWFESLEFIFRRRLWILAGLVAGLAGGGWLVLTTPPAYRAKARILLSDRATSDSTSANLSEARFRTEIALLMSPSLLRSVLGEPTKLPHERTGIPESDGLGRFIREHLPGLHARLHNEPDPEAAWIQAVTQGIEVSRVGGSNVLELAYTSRNPEWSASLVNRLIDQHIDHIASLREQTRARSFFESQADLMEQRWRAGRTRLDAFRSNFDGDFHGGARELGRQVLVSLEAERATAEADVLALRARSDFLLDEQAKRDLADFDTPREVAGPSPGDPPSQLRDLRLQRVEMLSRYPENSPFIAAIDRRIEEFEKVVEALGPPTSAPVARATGRNESDAVLSRARADLIAAETRLDTLSSQIEKYSRKLKDLQTAGTELERLENEVELAEEAHQFYLRKAEEARFSTAMDESKILNVTVIERAEVPTIPLPSGSRRKLAFGFLAGTVLGLAGGLIRDVWDPTVKSAAQAARLSRAELIAEVSSS